MNAQSQCCKMNSLLARGERSHILLLKFPTSRPSFPQMRTVCFPETGYNCFPLDTLVDVNTVFFLKPFFTPTCIHPPLGPSPMWIPLEEHFSLWRGSLYLFPCHLSMWLLKAKILYVRAFPLPGECLALQETWRMVGLLSGCKYGGIS